MCRALFRSGIHTCAIPVPCGSTVMTLHAKFSVCQASGTSSPSRDQVRSIGSLANPSRPSLKEKVEPRGSMPRSLSSISTPARASAKAVAAWGGETRTPSSSTVCRVKPKAASQAVCSKSLSSSCSQTASVKPSGISVFAFKMKPVFKLSDAGVVEPGFVENP
jgi:hypothetical protein